MSEYIHGYTDEEQSRLLSQNDVLSKYIYDRLDFSHSKRLLEVGVGVGAHMIYLLRQYPDLHITGIDISAEQIATAKRNLEAAGIPSTRYHLQQADARATNFDQLNVDTVLLIWVLEHIPQPELVLRELKRILKPGTKLFITEVFNSSLSFYPPNPAIAHFWQQLNLFQTSINGDGDIGLRLGNLLHDEGFSSINIRPYPLLMDKRNDAARKEIFVYWKSLAYSSLPAMKTAGFSSDKEWETVSKAFDDLLEDEEGVFYYSFIQVVVVV